MARELAPRDFFSRWPSLFDWEESREWLLPKSPEITISEDDERVYVEAPVPGIDPDKIEVTFDKGVLSIRGSEEETEEDKKKKYFRKSARSYSYRVTVPGDIDQARDPEITCKDGILTATFAKVAGAAEPKRLSVKRG